MRERSNKLTVPYKDTDSAKRTHTADCPLTHHITDSNFDHINRIVDVNISVFLLLINLLVKL